MIGFCRKCKVRAAWRCAALPCCSATNAFSQQMPDEIKLARNAVNIIMHDVDNYVATAGVEVRKMRFVIQSGSQKAADHAAPRHRGSREDHQREIHRPGQSLQMNLGPDRRAARHVDRILKGEKSLRSKRRAEFKLAVDLKTAKYSGSQYRPRCSRRRGRMQRC